MTLLTEIHSHQCLFAWANVGMGILTKAVRKQVHESGSGQDILIRQ